MILLYAQRKDSAGAKEGDIVLARLADSPIGLKEPNFYVIIKSEDAAVEAQLQSMRDSGEPHPSIAYPYRVEKPGKEGDPVITEVSSKTADLSQYPDKADTTKPIPIEQNPAKAPITDKPKEVKAVK